MSSEVDPNPEPSRPEPMSKAVHKAVLLDEVLHWLNPREGSILVDGTAGAGGHTRALAERVGTSGRVVGLDRDPNMLALAAIATSDKANVTLVRSSYSEVENVLETLELGRIDGLLLDLGLSSDQLAWHDRGFSFANDGPLDMRFDPDSDGPTAADLVNTLKEQELADLFFKYGEERHSRRVAWRIVDARKLAPIKTTGKLAELVRKSIPGKWGPIDPATRVFQALRVAVNNEVGHLERTLSIVPELLKIGGRFAIISFHSLEDRPVKHAFRDDPRLNVLTKKPITASDGELALNPRSRSAKLRVAERCPTPGTPTTPTSPSRRKGF